MVVALDTFYDYIVVKVVVPMTAVLVWNVEVAALCVSVLAVVVVVVVGVVVVVEVAKVVVVVVVIIVIIVVLS